MAGENRLAQDGQGRWNLTISHDAPGVVIPAWLSYDSIREDVNIENTQKTIETHWYTELNVPIDPDEIEKYAAPVVKDGKTYIVKDWRFAVVPWSGETGSSISMVLSQNTIASSGGEITLSILSDTSWTISKDKSFVSLSSTAGTGNGTVTVSVNEYTSSAQNRTVTFTATTTDGTASAKTALTQTKASGSEAYITLKLSQTAITASGGQVTLTVSSNTSWTLEKSDTFASLSVTAGTNTKDVTVTVPSYTSTTKNRTIYFTGKTTDESASATTGLTQRKVSVTHELEVTPSTATLNDGDTVQLSAKYYTLHDGVRKSVIDVTTNSRTVWTTSDSNYATVSGGLVTAKNLSSEYDRTAVITATYGSTDDSATITVNKKASPVVMSYAFFISASPTQIEWDGVSQLSGEFVTYADGVEESRIPVDPAYVTWTITQHPECISGGVVNSQGQLVANNNDAYTNWTPVNVKGVYNSVESSEIQVYVGKKPEEQDWYEIKILPTLVYAASSETVTLVAQFWTHPAGGGEPSYIDITSAATWTTNMEQAASVSAGTVTTHNETYQEQIVTINASYSGYYGTSTVVVAEKSGVEPSYYYVLVVTPTAATLEYRESVQLAAHLYMYESGNPTPINYQDVTKNSEWRASDNTWIAVSNTSMSKGKVESYNYSKSAETAYAIATYTDMKGNTYSASSLITAAARNINISIDTTPIDSECSGDRTFTKAIQTDADVTWRVSFVDVEHITHEVDWVSASPVSGTGSGTVTITIAGDNYNKVRRHCFARVFYPADGDTFIEFEINQYPTPYFSVASRTLSVPQLGSTERVYVATNYPLALSNNGNDWITLSQSDSGASGYCANIEVSEATTTSRTGTVTITSTYSGSCTLAPDTSATITIEQDYTPPVPPQPNGVVHVYASQQAVSAQNITLNANAAEQDVEFYISTNTNCIVTSHSAGITVKETNGTNVTSGATIVPTGLDNKRKLLIHIPMNIYTGYNEDRTFSVQIEATNGYGYQSIATVTVNQRHNEYYDSAYTMLFGVPGQTNLGQTEVTWNSSAQGFRLGVQVNAIRVYTAGYSSETRMEDYITSGSGVDENKMTLEITPVGSATIATDVGHGGAYVPTYEYPYEIYVPANETFDQTGATKDIVFTLTYRNGVTSVTRTVTVHQEWAHKQLPVVNMNLNSGSPENLVQVGAGTATTTLNGKISLETNSDTLYVTGETGVTIVVAGEYGRFEVGGDMMYGVPYDLGASGGKSITITNKASAGSQYNLTITCMKSERASKVLNVTVVVV